MARRENDADEIIMDSPESESKTRNIKRGLVLFAGGVVTVLVGAIALAVVKKDDSEN